MRSKTCRVHLATAAGALLQREAAAAAAAARSSAPPREVGTRPRARVGAGRRSGARRARAGPPASLTQVIYPSHLSESGLRVGAKRLGRPGSGRIPR